MLGVGMLKVGMLGVAADGNGKISGYVLTAGLALGDFFKETDGVRGLCKACIGSFVEGLELELTLIGSTGNSGMGGVDVERCPSVDSGNDDEGGDGPAEGIDLSGGLSRGLW